MSTNLAVSVVIITYRQAPLLDLSLLALADEDTSLPYEIIVCDDGPSLETLPIVRKWSRTFRELSYFWTPFRGFRAGEKRNRGMSIARGELIIFLDGDMVIAPGFIEAHHAAHQTQDPPRLVSGGRLNCHDYDLLGALPDAPRASDLQYACTQCAWLNEHEAKAREQWWHSAMPWRAIFSCNLSMPRSYALRYSSWLVGWGIEDWDLALNYSIRYGASAVTYAPQISAFHVDYKPAIFNAFRNDSHHDLVLFAHNVLRFIDEHQEMTLTECAAALRRYQWDDDANVWRWSFSDRALRDTESGIALLRSWLIDAEIYECATYDRLADADADTLAQLTNVDVKPRRDLL